VDGVGFIANEGSVEGRDALAQRAWRGCTAQYALRYCALLCPLWRPTCGCTASSPAPDSKDAFMRAYAAAIKQADPAQAGMQWSLAQQVGADATGLVPSEERLRYMQDSMSRPACRSRCCRSNASPTCRSRWMPSSCWDDPFAGTGLDPAARQSKSAVQNRKRQCGRTRHGRWCTQQCSESDTWFRTSADSVSAPSPRFTNLGWPACRRARRRCSLAPLAGRGSG
jgi:hypothetical protein